MVDCVDHVLRRDHSAAVHASVEATVGVLATLHAVELEVDLAVVVVECKANVHNVTVLVFALGADVFLELFLPASLGLPVNLSAEELVRPIADGTDSAWLYMPLSRMQRLGAGSLIGAALWGWALGATVGSGSSVLASLRISASRE